MLLLILFSAIFLCVITNIQKQPLLLLIYTTYRHTLVRIHSKTTFVTVNQKLPKRRNNSLWYSKTTFVTVNPTGLIFIRVDEPHSKTTFVTVNAKPMRGGFRI